MTLLAIIENKTFIYKHVYWFFIFCLLVLLFITYKPLYFNVFLRFLLLTNVIFFFWIFLPPQFSLLFYYSVTISDIYMYMF